jgi:hypothetical protein
MRTEIAVLIALVSLSGVASAKSPVRSLAIAAGSDQACPGDVDLALAIRDLLPQVKIVPDSDDEDGQADVIVKLRDDGATYHVWVGDAERDLADPERKCEKRARAAAIFVAMTVELPPDPPPPVPATPSLPLPPPANPPKPAPYPQALIDRPPNLPPHMVQLSAAGALTNTGGLLPNLNGVVVSVAQDAGITPWFQLGAFLSAPVYPNADLGALLLNAQFAVGRSVALRVELGYERPVVFDLFSNQSTSDAFSFSTGPTGKWRLSRTLAITWGSTPGMRLGRLLDAGGVYESIPFNSDSAFSISAGRDIMVSFGLPAGLLLQPLPSFAVHLSVRPDFLVSRPSWHSADIGLIIPVELDLVWTPIPSLDIGASAGLLGTLTGNSRYTDVRDFGLWVRVRI